jgi:hypothetical protein
MKTTKITYWISTILFVAFMIFSSISQLTVAEEAIQLFASLGYPKYLIGFIGVAKLLGCIALLVPGFPRINEWAYAGLCFDLVGAMYSVIFVFGYDHGLLTMIPVFAAGIISYLTFHKLNNARALKSEAVQETVLARG